MPLVATTGFSHVVVRATDVERSMAWYAEVLGHEVLWNGHAPTADRTRSVMGLTAGGTVALERLRTPRGRPHDIDTLGVAGLSLTTSDIRWPHSTPALTAQT